MDEQTAAPWWRRISWISLANMVLLLLGVLGFWRDRIIVNEAKLEQQTVTLGEIKSDVGATRDLVQKTSTDVEVLKSQQTNTAGKVDELGRRMEGLEGSQQRLTERVGVLEQRTRR